MSTPGCKDCTVKVSISADNEITTVKGAQIYFCPLHKAAPDLLEACKAALENLEEVPGRERQWACEQLEAAIAKATGK